MNRRRLTSEQMESILEECGNNLSEAARLLHITPQAVQQKVKRLGIVLRKQIVRIEQTKPEAQQ